MTLINALQQSVGLSSRAEEDRLHDLLRALPDARPAATAVAAVAQATLDRWGPVESPGSVSSALPQPRRITTAPTPAPSAANASVLNAGLATAADTAARRTITVPTQGIPDGGAPTPATEPTRPTVTPPPTPDRRQAMAVTTPEPSAEPVDAAPSVPPPERSADELTSISTAWARYHDADPYRLFQMMAEFGWTAQDLSQASGLGLQDVSDYLTRIGAPVGFGGAVTVSGESLLQPLRDALQAAYLNRPPPGTSASGQALPPGWCEEITLCEGERCIDTHFDLGAFMTHYLASATPEVPDFLRIYGAVQSTSQTSVTFAGGLTVTQAPNADQTGGWTSPSVNWNTDARIGCYETYAHSNALEQAALRNLVDTPQNQQLIDVFGSANLSLPETAMAERMRALYGSDLATLMYRQSRAIDEMHRQYVAELNAALAQQPPSDQINAAAPAWWKPGDIQYSDDYTHTPISQTYLFDPAAYQAWYAEQPSIQHQLIAQAYGLGAQAENLSANSPPPSDNEPITAFRTTGTLDSLQLSLGHDNLGHLIATDIGLTTCQGLTRVNLEDPPHLADDSQVAFMPLRGFVTTNSNVKADVTFLDEALPICVMAGFSYISANALGPAMAAGMGMTTTTAAGAVALTTVGVATSAAVTGAVTSVVGGLINANLSLKGIVQGALSGALTAGLMDLARPLAQTGLLGTLATQTTIQGGVQALMGGDFEDGALAGFASGLSSALSADINANIEQSFEMGLMTGPEVDAARYMASMLAAAVKIVACGTDDPGYALASAFLNETFGLMDNASESPAESVDLPEVTQTPAPPTNGDWMNAGNDEPALAADPPAPNPPPAAEPPAMAQPAPPVLEVAPVNPKIDDDLLLATFNSQISSQAATLDRYVAEDYPGGEDSNADLAVRLAAEQARNSMLFTAYQENQLFQNNADLSSSAGVENDADMSSQPVEADPLGNFIDQQLVLQATLASHAVLQSGAVYTDGKLSLIGQSDGQGQPIASYVPTDNGGYILKMAPGYALTRGDEVLIGEGQTAVGNESKTFVLPATTTPNEIAAAGTLAMVSTQTTGIAFSGVAAATDAALEVAPGGAAWTAAAEAGLGIGLMLMPGNVGQPGQVYESIAPGVRLSTRPGETHGVLEYELRDANGGSNWTGSANQSLTADQARQIIATQRTVALSPEELRNAMLTPGYASDASSNNTQILVRPPALNADLQLPPLTLPEDGASGFTIPGSQIEVQNWQELVISSKAGGPQGTTPIDYDHVIGADFNSNGKPTGGHSLLTGNVRIIPGTESAPDITGVYEATVQMSDPNKPGQWITKLNNDSVNSMFPKNWDENRIKAELDAAWSDPNKIIKGSMWFSRTPSGVVVEGWISPKTTAYPIYQNPTKP